MRDASGQLVGVEHYRPNPERRDDGPKMQAAAGSRRALFPAPETIDAGRLLFLLEGEPDAVRATSLGLAAVAVPGVGAWRSEWASRFAGRRVVVCFDCDKPGREAAQRVAHDLAGVAGDVRVLDLAADRVDGFDVSDFTAAAKTAAEREQARALFERMAGLAPRVEPPQAEDGAELLDELVSFLRRFVAMSATQADATACWVLHTHTLAAFETTPYLSVSSAEKRSGKSRLLELLALLCARPLRAAGVTEAALFRLIADRTPTLLMDEVDAVFGPKSARDHEDLRALLNSGYRKGTPVLRCVGDAANMRVAEFPVFCCKALAGIGELPDTIADRCLPVRLKRRAAGEHVERFRERKVKPEAAALQARLAAFAALHLDALTLAEPELPEELDDRAQDALEPLIALADVAGADWPSRARRAFVELRTQQHTPDDGSLGIRLLADVRTVFEQRDVDRLATTELIGALVALDEAPWADLYGKPVTALIIGRLLGHYDVRSRTIRLDDGSTPKGYKLDSFEDAWSRYTPLTAGSIRHTATTGMDRGIAAIPLPPQEPLVADEKTGENPHGYRDVADVADRSTDTGAGTVPAASEPMSQSRPDGGAA